MDEKKRNRTIRNNFHLPLSRLLGAGYEAEKGKDGPHQRDPYSRSATQGTHAAIDIEEATPVRRWC